MARRHDSGWRDSRLELVHSAVDIAVPAAGMTLPMVEYDRGEAVAVISYLHRGVQRPKGPEVARAYRALGGLYGPTRARLPFLTARYDPRNWAFQLFGHNDAARDLIGTAGCLTVTEEHFVRLLYRLRGNTLPAGLELHDVRLSTAPWLPYYEGDPVRRKPVTDISQRRRYYEPVGDRIPFRLRNPCADIDLAVIGDLGRAALLVDFKHENAKVDPGHHTHRAMSSLSTEASGHLRPVPSMIVRYDPSGDRWKFHAFCLNLAARDLLTGVMLDTDAVTFDWVPDGWTYLDEDRWFLLLEAARRN